MSYTRSFLSFDNSGSDFDLPKQQREFNRKLKILEDQGAIITGRRRAIAANRLAGGKAYSQHLLGLAADIRSRDLTDAEIALRMRKARELGLTVVSPQAEVAMGNPPHIHVQAFPPNVIPKRVYTQIGVQIREEP